MDKASLEKYAAKWQQAYVAQGVDPIRAAHKASRAHALSTAIIRAVYQNEMPHDKQLLAIIDLVIAHDATEKNPPPAQSAFDKLAADAAPAKAETPLPMTSAVAPAKAKK